MDSCIAQKRKAAWNRPDRLDDDACDFVPLNIEQRVIRRPIAIDGHKDHTGDQIYIVDGSKVLTSQHNSGKNQPLCTARADYGLRHGFAGLFSVIHDSKCFVFAELSLYLMLKCGRGSGEACWQV